MTTTLGLDQPRIASGEARTYFFNGRLLSAEDLQREQTAREAGQRRLARLAGCGIERGLGLRWQGGSLLTIEAGLGVTPAGDVVETESFELDIAGSVAAGASGGRFGDCAARFGSLGALAGLHLLVLTPGWIGDGRAPTLLGEVGACNRKLELPGVRARLVALRAPAGASATDLRNRVAHALAATAGLDATRLLGWWPATVAPTLRADDLPLAVLAIGAGGAIDWIDVDAARRRLAPPPGAESDALWPRSERVAMEALARQCAAQLRDSATLALARAAEATPAAFALLPPALLLDDATGARWQAVFADELPLPDEIALGRAAFAAALDQALADAPVPRDRASLRLYRLWQADETAAPQWLLRLRDADAPDTGEIDAGSNWCGGAPTALATGERSSARVAALAGRVLGNPQTSAEERSLAGSVLTQAPDKLRRPARKRPGKPG
ncbi:hypothetical protein [Derxia lacustris]|uniref:hypothetical protein n=1 Tax=Derxia lacustris TaxID=764842 RepID=UPI000A178010|nr:hypothetical protein [Derxia lacustris]